jgi:NDP-hexose-3-ketoreductase
VAEPEAARQLAIGVIGCADIAVRKVLPALVAQDRIRLVAVASRDRAKAQRVGAMFGCAGVAGYRALLARDDLDAVYIPLPPALHHDWVSAALAAGKHVLVEKPLCTTYADTAAVVALARSRGLVLAENFMFLHHGQHAEVQSLVSTGLIGPIRVFSGSFAVPPLRSTSYRYRPELGGGALLDTGVYPLRAAQLFLPGELEVLGACLRVDAGTGVDVAGSALLCTADGVSIQLDFGFEHAYRSRYALWGGAGRISVLRAFTPPDQLRPVVRLEQQDRLTELSLPPTDQVANSMTAFADAVLSDSTRLSLGEAQLRQAALLERIRQVATIVDRRDVSAGTPR